MIDMTAGTNAGYSGFSRLLHWLTVLLIVVVFGVTYFWDGPDHRALLQVHKSVGITILALMLIRLGQWLFLPRSQLLPGPRLQHAAARISHVLLYAVFLLQPMLGWANAMMTGKTVNFYLSGVMLPSFLPHNAALGKELIEIHATMPNIILALLAIHISAALYHHFLVKDRTLHRMISGA